MKPQLHLPDLPEVPVALGTEQANPPPVPGQPPLEGLAGWR